MHLKFTQGIPHTMVTAYDYHSARICAEADVDSILVGDSLGMVIQGNQNTLGVTLDDMIYHTKMVRTGAPNSFIITDMPFLSYHTSIIDTIKNAGRIIQETNSNAVKLEVNSINTIEHINALIEAQIPVVAHIGLTPQSVNILGGFKVQGKTTNSAEHIIHLAQLLAKTKISALVLECIPAALAKEISELSNAPTVGIGCGSECAGQVLVFHDLLGISTSHKPRFVKQYLNANELLVNAIKQYKTEVQNKTFPSAEHQY